MRIQGSKVDPRGVESRTHTVTLRREPRDCEMGRVEWFRPVGGNVLSGVDWVGVSGGDPRRLDYLWWEVEMCSGTWSWVVTPA